MALRRHSGPRTRQVSREEAIGRLYQMLHEGQICLDSAVLQGLTRPEKADCVSQKLQERRLELTIQISAVAPEDAADFIAMALQSYMQMVDSIKQAVRSREQCRSIAYRFRQIIEQTNQAIENYLQQGMEASRVAELESKFDQLTYLCLWMCDVALSLPGWLPDEQEQLVEQLIAEYSRAVAELLRSYR